MGIHVATDERRMDHRDHRVVDVSILSSGAYEPVTLPAIAVVESGNERAYGNLGVMRSN
jgi:hypothetical protein